MGYIPQPALENLHKYHYRAVDRSLMSKYVLCYWWTWLVELWPLYVAPNTITLIGLIVVILNLFTLFYYDPLYLGVEMPRWVYASWALGLFIYQSFDAVDGKQARRTGMAGPLGELFDHGCDAVNTSLELLLTMHALSLTHTPWLILAQLFTLANFYLTTWEEYVTGWLYLGIFSGPVEGLCILECVYLITWWFGPQSWNTPLLSFLGLDTRLSTFFSSLSSSLSSPSIHQTFLSKTISSLPPAYHQPLTSILLKSLSSLSSHLLALRLNESFMIFSGIGLACNTWASFGNVWKAMRERVEERRKEKLEKEEEEGKEREEEEDEQVKVEAGYMNGHAKANGHANRHANGHANGNGNGHAPTLTNGHAAHAPPPLNPENPGKTITNPLFLLVPFFITISLQIAWLSAPIPWPVNSSSVVGSVGNDTFLTDFSSSFHNSSSPSPSPPTPIYTTPLLPPLILAAGFAFAHQVGRMVLAHVTESPFPRWDVGWWTWGGIVCADLYADRVWGFVSEFLSQGGLEGPPTGRLGGFLHSTPHRATFIVYLTFLVALVRYLVWVVRVVREVTEYLGVGCFTVTKRKQREE